jgi:phage host-nuclease inhibitor protein Gam
MKIKIPKFKSREEFLSAVDEAARITVDIQSLEASLATRIQEAQEHYGPAITGRKADLTAIFVQAEKFAEEHQCELLLGKARSAETPLARYGFRTGMPQVKTLSRWTFTQVLEALVLVGAKMAAYVRTKKELDKDAILAASARGALTAADLAVLGMKVAQEEAFFIDPKVDGAEQVKPAAK